MRPTLPQAPAGRGARPRGPARSLWVGELAARRAGESLQDWICRGLREAMLDGQLRSGMAIPSTRQLAARLGVARGTVIRACDELVAQGYLVARRGAAMRVAPQLPERWLHAAPPRTPEVAARPALPRVWTPFASPPARAFAPHRCETRELPFDVLRRIHSRLLRRSNAWFGSDAPVGGLPALRRAIAAYLGEARGVVVDAEQVIVVSSVQQALDLAVRVLTRPGDPVWLEDPGYAGHRRVVEVGGREPAFVPVDAQGIDVAAGIAAAPVARLACVTPCRQSPLGVPLSLPRRAALIAWARASGAVVFEDDYDSEFRFASRPVRPLAAEAPDVAILAGSFSKLLYPGLRMAYLVAPRGWAEAFGAFASIVARQPNQLAQEALAAFVDEGHLHRHVRRMRRLYAERAEAFADLARRHWHGLLELPALQAGLDVTARLALPLEDAEAARRLREAGVESIPMSAYRGRVAMPPALVLGFGALRPEEMLAAAPQVARALQPRPGAARSAAQAR